MDDGRWLIEGRSYPTNANAIVLTPYGAVIARFKLGDGVSHMGIDASDRICVGWTDEGIFGNGDWKVRDHEWPPCSNGVACFDPNGALLPPPKWPDGSGDIAHCYALNVSGQGAWICPYTDFPLVHFVPGKPARWWRNVLSGPSAMAVNETHALIAGGYGAQANRVTLVALDEVGQGADVRQLASWDLPLRRLPPPPNEWAPVWSHPDLLTGRGDVLHLVDNGVWQRWRVTDLAART